MKKSLFMQADVPKVAHTAAIEAAKEFLQEKGVVDLEAAYAAFEAGKDGDESAANDQLSCYWLEAEIIANNVLYRRGFDYNKLGGANLVFGHKDPSTLPTVEELKILGVVY